MKNKITLHKALLSISGLSHIFLYPWYHAPLVCYLSNKGCGWIETKVWPWFSVVESKHFHCGKVLRKLGEAAGAKEMLCLARGSPYHRKRAATVSAVQIPDSRYEGSSEIPGCLHSTCSSICCPWGHFPGEIVSLETTSISRVLPHVLYEVRILEVQSLHFACFSSIPWSLYAEVTAREAVMSIFPQKFSVTLACLVFYFNQCFWLWKKRERKEIHVFFLCKLVRAYMTTFC